MKSIALLVLLLSSHLYAECVHEKIFSGFELQMQKKDHKVFVEKDNGIYEELLYNKINSLQFYRAQLVKKNDHSEGDFTRYNQKYVEYYRYQNIIDFMNSTRTNFTSLGYEISVIGKSLKGRDLYAVKPKNFDSNKKTIVMFGRHHGNEGTANWIIEGFINEFLSATEDFHENYQLLLYPMVNPDGAEAMSRYNENGRDLNRSWGFDITDTYDEAKVIHKNLKPYMKYKSNMPIFLDMHGSFTEDFIYRVKKNYVDISFFNRQQEFIDELAGYDIWQNGVSKLSNGHPKMARLVMVNSYGLNALTHETPRDIKLNSRSRRSKSDLYKQGIAIFQSITNIY